MNILKKLRNERNITQKELSILSGLSIKTIQSYEQYERDIDLAYFETLLNLSIALNCKISDLIESEELKEKCKQAKL